MTTFEEPARSRTTPVFESAPPASVRASDAEREAVVARLHGALGEGRLDLAETDLRVAAVYAARHRSELPALLADLPEPTRTGPPPWSELWDSTVWAARDALLGHAHTDGARPTAAQCRTAAWMVALTVLWMVGCAVLGAAVVGS